jgi:peptidoglycan/LPS O-acetylase OafA/YrhL
MKKGVIPMKAKKVIVCSLLGLVGGVILSLFLQGGSPSASLAYFYSITMQVTLLGCLIAVNPFDFSWWKNGLIVGFLIGLPLIGATMLGPQPEPPDLPSFFSKLSVLTPVLFCMAAGMIIAFLSRRLLQEPMISG